MDHDPLCPVRMFTPELCPRCRYIARVRADQDVKWHDRIGDLQASEFKVGHDAGYRKGAADERVKAAVEQARIDKQWAYAVRCSRLNARADAIRECIAVVYGSCGHTKYEGWGPCPHEDISAALRALLPEEES